VEKTAGGLARESAPARTYDLAMPSGSSTRKRV